MAIGWLTALKMVPWGDVIENAPTLVNGAKKLFTKTRSEAPAPQPAITPTAAGAETKTVDQRIAQLQALLDQSHTRVTALEAESRDTATLIKSLAEQQEKVITAIDVLRKRTHVLIASTAILGLACVALAVALAMAHP